MRKLTGQESNAKVVLANLEEFIENGCAKSMREVYSYFGIFDWWVDNLTISRAKQMRSFLKEAIKLGYTGKVSFKVGAAGCANGMWAHKKESTDGYDPDGEFIYRSFTPSYTYYSLKDAQGRFPETIAKENGVALEYDGLKTIRDLESFIEQYLNK